MNCDEIDQDCKTECPESDDGQHCNHWYDGDACCYCEAPAEAGYLDDE